MAERRIRFAKRQAEFMRSLLAQEDEGGGGPFRTQVDVLAFAAAVAARENQVCELGEAAKEPIRYEVFERRNYDALINLLAVYRTERPSVLADTSEAEAERAEVFESYATAGLDILAEELKGAPELQEALLMFIRRVVAEHRSGDREEFDLREFLE